ncbi:MAG: efflux transporter periplasmic adaptor subunit [Gemmataceae bacterium]|nr:efflux transporter periplasmic adaptor subunit [Gemmataceae bacterium]
MSATTAEDSAPTPRARWPRVLALGALVVLLLVGGLAAGTVPRVNRDRAVREQAAAIAAEPPRVAVATATRVAADAMRVLPGTCLPLTETAIYPRTTGYVKRRAVDIGDRVEAGQVLAEIATPEVDAQLEQARAALTQDAANVVRAQAQEVYARAQVKREQRAYESGAESRDLYDSAVANFAVTTATVRATEATLKVDEANIRRLEAVQSFQKVTAPFDGVITARNVDPGALVQADTPATVRELFHLMRTDVVRVWVYVPQTFATALKPGQKATVYRREDPARMFAGTVVRTADALDPSTRTLLAEIHVRNPDNVLRPGMYLQVKFTFDREVFPVTIPAAAVVIRTEAPTVGVLDPSNTVHYRKVQLGRDHGAEVEVTVGLSPGEVVVVRPGDELPDGALVEPVAPAK